MRTAVRAHENPALDVALLAGEQLGLPVFVYHALSERYPFASDRHHTFMLQGARDVEAECAARGIGYAFHLERPGHRTKALLALAQRAACIVTETMPVPPLDWLTEALADAAPCPVLSVDTACIVPMPLVGQAHTRAFAYRDATKRLRAERAALPWPDVSATAPRFLPASLPFEPVPLATADPAALVATCDIDHGVAPVAETPGGSTAGYARWRAFRQSGRLAQYAKRRNDATDDGVSRMSAYLHYGMVSPMQLVRECVALGGDGADKYLDELLVWRELAYAFCYWHESPTTMQAIPPWARATLAQHERDARHHLSWETLARSRTGDVLWDATQRSLRVHGELHNNVRMTWGKAIPLWSDNAEEMLARLVDLNHRYALDGRDPASYGGLLWCLGQFDRPFTPPTRILGTVRPRSTHEHVHRLNLSAYQTRVERSLVESMPRVIVVGAGAAGLACARTLHDHGVAVTVLEKSRGVGGRLSTRREGLWHFDHGAPSFRLDDPRMRALAGSWQHDDVLRALNDGAFVGSRGMNSLPKHVASDLDVQTGVHVASLAHDGARWTVTDRNGVAVEGEVVLLAAPAPQAAALLRTHDGASALEPMTSALADVRMRPCWSTMVVFAAPPPAAVTDALRDGSFETTHGMLWRGWRQSSRPGRTPDEAWVVHSDAQWSAAHLEEPPEAIAARVSTALGDHLQIAGTVLHADAHRWRYARVETGLDVACLYNPAIGIGACGDWGEAGALRRSRTSVERAWLSGVALAGRVLGQLI